MKAQALLLAPLGLLLQVSQACTPVTYTDDSGRELSKEQVVQIFFNNSAYVIVGDVIEAEYITEYETVNGRRRPHTHQKAVVLVRKSWKSSKREGDRLRVYTDLSDSCSRALKLGSQSLIYASGSEPVELSGWSAISELGFSSDDVVFLNRIASNSPKQGAPNKPLQRTRSEQRDSER